MRETIAYGLIVILALAALWGVLHQTRPFRRRRQRRSMRGERIDLFAAPLEKKED